MKHQWLPPNDTIVWTYCGVCLAIQNPKNVDRECKGRSRLTLRADDASA